MVTIRLSDGADPRLPFFFRLGDHVRSQSDPRQQGVVIDGLYTGPPPGDAGSHDIVYQVKRADDLVFDAKQIQLELSRRDIPYKGHTIEASAQRLASGKYSAKALVVLKDPRSDQW